jgi:hypothetical protein
MRQRSPHEPSVQLHATTEPGLGPDDRDILEGIGRRGRNTLGGDRLLPDPVTEPGAARLEANDGSRRRLGIALAALIALVITGVGYLVLRRGDVPAPTAATSSTPALAAVSAPPAVAPTPTPTASAEPVPSAVTASTNAVAPQAPAAPATYAARPGPSAAPRVESSASRPSGSAVLPPLRVNLDGIEQK